MKNKFLALLSIVFLTVLSCKKEDNTSSGVSGILSKVSVVYGGEEQVFTQFEYDGNNRLIKMTFESAVYRFEYDEQNRPKNMYYYDQDSKKVYTQTLNYDSAGQLVQRIKYSKSDYNTSINVLTTTINISADKKTWIEKEGSYTGTGSYTSTIFTFNDAGQLLSYVGDGSEKYEYSGGNIVKSYHSDGAVRYTATFDTKKNPYTFLSKFLCFDFLSGRREPVDFAAMYNTNNLTKLQEYEGGRIYSTKTSSYEYSGEYPIKNTPKNDNAESTMPSGVYALYTYK